MKPLKIHDVSTAVYRCPLPFAWSDQTHGYTHIEVLIADVTADNGLQGTGFSYSVGVGAMAAMALIRHYMLNGIVGSTVSPRAQWGRMWSSLHDAGGGGVSTLALAPIDIALWDLYAKARKVSFADLFGKVREKIPVYGSGIDLHYELKELEEEVRDWVDQGYEAVKVKVGKVDVEEDVERVAAVRKIVGRNRRLMIDANQGWDGAKAPYAMEALQKFLPYWVEEPLISDDILGYQRLRRNTRSPIAMGENVYNKYQFNQYFASYSCDFAQPDIVRVGGITPFFEIAALADAWNLPLAPHFMREITGQIVCCIKNAHILEDVKGGSFAELGIVENDAQITGGQFVPQKEPGHGIVFNRDKLDRYRIAS